MLAGFGKRDTCCRKSGVRSAKCAHRKNSTEQENHTKKTHKGLRRNECVHNFIVGVQQRFDAKQTRIISGNFPKEEVVAPGLGPGLPLFLRLEAPHTLLSESYLVKDFTAAASSSFTSKTV
jgi:hypothetical protein